MKITSSNKAKRTFNPIRAIVDNLKPPQNHNKKLLNLALGDPTAYGNLQCPDVLIEGIKDSLIAQNSNGYQPSTGSGPARKAIAQVSSLSDCIVTEDDVIVCSGCSGALELAISVLVNEGDNILVPRPGFPLYQVITESIGGNVKHYSLNPENEWECNLEEMDNLVDENTKAILITNPSNPCGSSYSSEHLTNIVAIARKHQLPIIADEIYGGLVFNGSFTPIASVSNEIPVLSVSGLAKEFIVPGWRVGWVVVYDRSTTVPKLTHEIKSGLKSLSQIILGACSLIQSVVPRVLLPTPGSKDYNSLQSFHQYYMNVLSSNAQICYNESLKSPYLYPVLAKGAMYCMIGIKMNLLQGFTDDRDFSAQLLTEENVFVLPGQCFGMVNFIRLVTCPPSDILTEAIERICLFCERHGIIKNNNINNLTNGLQINNINDNDNDNNEDDDEDNKKRKISSEI